MTLLQKLLTADVVCKDCGTKYGTYSVGCSSTWQGTCGVCGEDKPITEVRDWGYLTKGINELKGQVKEQSKEVAEYMLSVGPLMNDDELEDALTPSYEQGEIACMFTKNEIGFLNECLDIIQEYHPGLEGDAHPADVALFESIEQKITTLYEDNCVKYELSPALKAYNAKYGTWGTGEDEARWEGFRDAYNLLKEENND